MVQLPPGRIEETRRGGADVLQIMVRDLVASKDDGYIRIERRPKAGLPRIGYMVFRDGQPTMALHESDIDRSAIEALMELEEDAMSIDAILTSHSGIDTGPLIELYPEALLHLERISSQDHEQAVSSGVGEWWNSERLETLSWKKATDLPDFIPSMKAPELIRRMSEARLVREASDVDTMLMGGYLHLVDSSDIASVMTLAGELNKRGRPLLSISRQRVEKQVGFYSENDATCLWLIERPTEDEHVGPSLESLLRLIEGWLEEYRSAVILFDGFEFLSGTHGDERAFGFLKRLADLVRDSDDILFLPVVLNAWEEILQHQMRRATDPLDFKAIEEWLIDPDVLDDHPFLELVMDADESAAVDKKINEKMGLETAAPVSVPSESSATESSVEQSNQGSLGELMQGWARESTLGGEDEDKISTAEWVPTFHSGDTGEMIETLEPLDVSVIEPSTPTEVQDLETIRGPRPALRARKRRVKQNISNNDITATDGLNAAAAIGKVIEKELPEGVSQMERKSSELGDASNNANEVAGTLPIPSRESKNAQEALERGSGNALERIVKSELPEASGDVDSRRNLNSWGQATEQDRAKHIADWPESTQLDQKASTALKAATDAAINPVHFQKKEGEEVISPMAARPGMNVKNEVKGAKSLSEKEQKSSDPVSVERRLREKEMKAYREWKLEGRINPDNVNSEEN
ncbi:MAG: DUF835 domain-containing protein [Candidatus Poseidoniaceae archaeon]|nr:DUF835 domain-containing protein [Candidatus Poseidoniaceae archaeon]MDP7203437.1 DUF835 domain-containing protein [Candidatus Poseidoniaceae archaeon]